MTLLPAALLLAGAIAFVAARAGTSASIAFANHRAVLSHPDHRSSHALPTPRLGGLGIAVGLAAGAIAVAFFSRALADDVGGHVASSLRQFPAGWASGCLGCCMAAFLTGVIDDFVSPPPLVKLAGQCAAGAIPAMAGVFPSSLQLPFAALPVSPLAGGIATFAFVVLMINVVNFIDGINGLAGRLCQLAVLVLLVGTSPDQPGGLVLILGAFVMLLSIEGFLTLNESRAATFMGDGGSHLLGAAVACSILLALSLEPPAEATSLAYLLPVSIPVFDVILTLLRRARRGERLLSAHREHLYQRHLAATGENHTRTRLFVLAHAGAATAVGLLILVRESAMGPLVVALPLLAVLACCSSYWLQVRGAERTCAA